MSRLRCLPVSSRSLDPFAELVGPRRLREAVALGARLGERLGDNAVWNVSSTAVGGGVAEMLRPLLAYSRGAGIDARWAVIGAEPEFFRITKRLHHALHGADGDGGELGDAERAVYESELAANAAELGALIRPGDVVLLHDPQTAGLAPHLIQRGALVIWRCHVGHDRPGKRLDQGWAFLAPYLEDVPAFVFSRAAYVPVYCDHGKSHVIAPSIDPFSPKNQELAPEVIRTILVHVGLVEGPPPPGGGHGFQREDGSRGRVERRADVIRLGRASAWEAPLVVQVSRWDPLKDMIGVMRGFQGLLGRGSAGDAELVLAGPNVTAVADDPEGARVFDDVVAAWRDLPHGVRDRVHLASLPTGDVEENAVVVNALQRHAAVVVQKSLHEGFGLTVTEAMWKARPVLASAVGGIQDQIEDRVHGVLLTDPKDLDGFADELGALLADPARAAALGHAARERVLGRYVGLRSLAEYAELILALRS
jgi:trehalose synthase